MESCIDRIATANSASARFFGRFSIWFQGLRRFLAWFSGWFDVRALWLGGEFSVVSHHLPPSSTSWEPVQTPAAILNRATHPEFDALEASECKVNRAELLLSQDGQLSAGGLARVS